MIGFQRRYSGGFWRKKGFQRFVRVIQGMHDEARTNVKIVHGGFHNEQRCLQGFGIECELVFFGNRWAYETSTRWRTLVYDVCRARDF